MRLHQFHPSGNCYKVRLLLHHLDLPVELVDVDYLGGETRTPAYRKINPIGRVPTLELDDGTFLPESPAILWYFAEGTPYLPADRLQRARVLQWMSFEQYDHEPYIAVARNWVSYAGIPRGKEGELRERQEKGRKTLAVMDEHLRTSDFFAATYSIADIALYAYTHVAREGEFDLSLYPHVLAWLERVRSQPRHIGITERP
ncbi:glutathione S-transferase family protein [Pendulispora brunnea]|uniref:Glutathione S-transferase family protein n=1 Tax=Pendulispora brunnea TaxID=2905690 RepID=A0ABZ2K8P6_9BACT